MIFNKTNGKVSTFPLSSATLEIKVNRALAIIANNHENSAGDGLLPEKIQPFISATHDFESNLSGGIHGIARIHLIDVSKMKDQQIVTVNSLKTFNVDVDIRVLGAGKRRVSSNGRDIFVAGEDLDFFIVIAKGIDKIESEAFFAEKHAPEHGGGKSSLFSGGIDKEEGIEIFDHKFGLIGDDLVQAEIVNNDQDDLVDVVRGKRDISSSRKVRGAMKGKEFQNNRRNMVSRDRKSS